MTARNRQDDARVQADVERELNDAMRRVGGEMNQPRDDVRRSHTVGGDSEQSSPDRTAQAELDEAIAAARREFGYGDEWQDAGEVPAECPSCGRVYENARACPVDGTQLRPIGKWEATTETDDPNEMFELAAQHYPTQER